MYSHWNRNFGNGSVNSNLSNKTKQPRQIFESLSGLFFCLQRGNYLPSPSAMPPPLPRGEAFRYHPYTTNRQRKQFLCRSFSAAKSPPRMQRGALPLFLFSVMPKSDSPHILYFFIIAFSKSRMYFASASMRSSVGFSSRSRNTLMSRPTSPPCITNGSQTMRFL